MIRNILKLALAFFLVSNTTSAATQISETTAERILETSGLNFQIAQYPGMMASGIEQQSQSGGELARADFYQAVLNASQKAYAPEPMVANVKATISEGFNEKEGKQLLKWYETKTAQQITQAEENASKAETLQQMMQLAPTLLGENANQEKLALVNRIDELINLTETQLDMHKNIALAVFSALVVTDQNKAQMDFSQFEQMISTSVEQSRSQIKQMVNLSLMYAYKDIPIEKLTEYESFLNTPEAKKFHTITLKGMEESFNEATAKFAKLVATSMHKEN